MCLCRDLMSLSPNSLSPSTCSSCNNYYYIYYYSTCSSLSLLSSTQLSRASLTDVTRVFTECDPQLRQLFARLLLCGYLITSLFLLLLDASDALTQKNHRWVKF